MNPVLIVEDNADLLETVGQVLEKDGFEVELAENGREALNILKRRRPFLIILDLMMPVMNGWEFLQLFQANRMMSDIPVIVCSAAKDQNVTGVEFMRKPLDLDQLVRVVHGYFDTSKIVQHV
jgi:CheY-like chemotaxis protein